MKWLILPITTIIAAMFTFRFVPVKDKNHKFWKFANSHPEVAYYFFKGEDCFMLFDYKPLNGYRPCLSSGKWEGPFRLNIPSRRCSLTIYGQSPYYQIALENFMKRCHV
jgi:hypothetical protein